MHMIFAVIGFSVLAFTQSITAQPAQALRDISIRTFELSKNPTHHERVYVDYVRILLDPAYLNLAPADRKLIDNISNQFKKLHATLVKTFMPILSQEDIDVLKTLVAQALETIHSSTIRKVGGIAFKNHVEMVIRSLMTIGQNQNSVENQIKFQWIKPLYLDNGHLSADMKKKLFSLFDNNNYQRWYVSTKNAVLKVAPSSETPVIDSVPSTMPTITPEPTAENIPLRYAPLIVVTEEEETVETLPMPKRAPQTKTEKPKPIHPYAKPTTPTPSTPTRKAPSTPISKPSAPSIPPKKTSPIVAAPQTAQKSDSTHLNSIAQSLIQQSLVAPLSTIQSIVAKVTPQEKFSLLKITDNSLYTALHAAASLARADIVAFLLQNLTPNERFEIITMREQDGQTALHLAASAKSAPNKGFKPAVVVEELLVGLTPAQKNELINMRDMSGSTALDISQGFNKTVTDILKRNSTR